ncbi:hypothetical protein SY83_07900 [Paenibacillus swuensis]|uniref:Uncharacterized protein n=1 Tax=Paenibacillus swuensis TaxID=1178515 RepID=A0A172TGX8_9BACL|nr:hypothetical protein [Paenibacillus swuensis]ANE46206.1 hypothetical protein SY83_07900 [Paenibacillus swuensis]
MAGNVLYIPYSIIMILVVIMLIVFTSLTKRTKTTKYIIAISLPILIVFQFYFWNLEFNDFAKSFVFPSKEFRCEYEHELKDLSIPLPERTVLKGREDVCSPFYSTFVNEDEFRSFYQEELLTMKNKGEIVKYKYLERNDVDGDGNKGFLVELASGSKVDIVIHKREDSNKWLISINSISK